MKQQPFDPGITESFNDKDGRLVLDLAKMDDVVKAQEVQA